jgi:putative methionine-R-sulfoxide reductase with GAF domain
MHFNDPSLFEALLSRLYQALNRCDTPRECAWAITREVMPFMQVDDCVIYLADAEQTTLRQSAAFGPKMAAQNVMETHLTLKFGEGIVGACAASRECIIVADTRLDARYVTDQQAKLSEIAVPVVQDGLVYAVIDSEHHAVQHYTAMHQRTLETLAFISAPFFARFNFGMIKG